VSVLVKRPLKFDFLNQIQCMVAGFVEELTVFVRPCVVGFKNEKPRGTRKREMKG